VAVAAPLQSASAATELTLEQALDAARRHILAEEPEIQPAVIEAHDVVALDSTTWGKFYYAFHFPSHANTHYHVSKESGFVQPVLVLTNFEAPDSSGYASASTGPTASRSVLDHLPPLTLTKVERWSDYVITVALPAPLAAEREPIGLGCQLRQASADVPRFHHPEFKRVLTVKSVNQAGVVTLTIARADVARFPIVDVYLFTATVGSHVSPRIDDIPNRSDPTSPAARP
jgi:hypothetical protein